MLAACSPSDTGSGTDSGSADGGAATADPALFAEGKFASAADIKAADDAGEDIVFVDSRVALDYESGHIPGAAHVPYFEAADHIDSLPKDRWIVTYCECPHAEAEQVADVLLDNGFTMVRVMDEGLQGWREIGGAVETGPPPQG
jgi:rhodanese-related sulfurtransferase